MSKPAVSALAPLPFDLVYSDGEPLDSEWHTEQIPLLKEVIRQAMAESGRSDFFVGGNMFVYYSAEQAWDVKKGRPYFRGPDVFWVSTDLLQQHRKLIAGSPGLVVEGVLQKRDGSISVKGERFWSLEDVGGGAEP